MVDNRIRQEPDITAAQLSANEDFNGATQTGEVLVQKSKRFQPDRPPNFVGEIVYDELSDADKTGCHNVSVPINSIASIVNAQKDDVFTNAFTAFTANDARKDACLIAKEYFAHAA